MCQPMVMMLKVPCQAELTSTIATWDGSSKRRVTVVRTNVLSPQTARSAHGSVRADWSSKPPAIAHLMCPPSPSLLFERTKLVKPGEPILCVPRANNLAVAEFMDVDGHDPEGPAFRRNAQEVSSLS